MNIFDELQQFLSATRDQNGKPLIAIIGPTASGKTALSVQIAKAFEGEVISADSRQVYKYMDIGTAKISPQEQKGVPHHLLDILEPDQEFTLADFKRLALKAIEAIHRRHHVPIIIGGTGLYLNAILENYQIPQVPPNYELRQQLAQYYEEQGAEALHHMLQEKDAQTAARIHPNNVRYVIRALEINLAGGMPKRDQKGEQLFHIFTIGIEWPRDVLYERINQRVDEQMAQGLLNEVKTLLMKGYRENLPSMSSLGYQELVDAIQGRCTLEEGIDQIKKNTRNYAKRQLTWFRHYQDVHWLSGESLEALLQPPKFQK